MFSSQVVISSSLGTFGKHLRSARTCTNTGASSLKSLVHLEQLMLHPNAVADQKIAAKNDCLLVGADRHPRGVTCVFLFSVRFCTSCSRKRQQQRPDKVSFQNPEEKEPMNSVSADQTMLLQVQIQKWSGFLGNDQEKTSVASRPFNIPNKPIDFFNLQFFIETH